jgi:hypothetical protein
MARTLKGESGHPSPDEISLTFREPVGVAGIITPWNSPLILCMRSVNPALAAGCTVACKMPGQTAQVSTLLAQVFSEVEGLPRGVANFFNESGSEGAQWLVPSPHTRGISFTGGTDTGAQIAQGTSATPAPEWRRSLRRSSGPALARSWDGAFGLGQGVGCGYQSEVAESLGIGWSGCYRRRRPAGGGGLHDHATVDVGGRNRPAASLGRRSIC